MRIGEVVEALEAGQKVARDGWNGKGLWICLTLEGVRLGAADGQNHEVEPFVVMCTADKKLVPWTCSQADLLALDWEVV